MYGKCYSEWRISGEMSFAFSFKMNFPFWGAQLQSQPQAAGVHIPSCPLSLFQPPWNRRAPSLALVWDVAGFPSWKMC